MTASKFFAYAKGIGAIIAALVAIGGFSLSLWNRWHPYEPKAKENYKVTDKVIEKLSQDIQRLHDEQVAGDQRVEAQVKLLASMIAQLARANRVAVPTVKLLPRPPQSPRPPIRKLPALAE